MKSTCSSTAFFRLLWVLPEDYCKKDPCNFSAEMFVSKVGQPLSNSWSTSSQPDFVRDFGRRKTVQKSPRFCTQSCSKVGQLLFNSSPTPHPMGSCRGLPCSSPLATPDYFFNSPRDFGALRFSGSARSEAF